MGVNAERCRVLAAHLRALPEKAPTFDADTWFCTPRRSYFYANNVYEHHNDCGTSACMAGHAVWLFGAERIDPWKEVADLARDLLGLSTRQAELLFIPWLRIDDIAGPGDITPERAAEVLERLAETDEVCWAPVAE